jgi:hypothetical protein
VHKGSKLTLNNYFPCRKTLLACSPQLHGVVPGFVGRDVLRLQPERSPALFGAVEPERPLRSPVESTVLARLSACMTIAPARAWLSAAQREFHHHRFSRRFLPDRFVWHQQPWRYGRILRRQQRSNSRGSIGVAFPFRLSSSNRLDIRSKIGVHMRTKLEINPLTVGTGQSDTVFVSPGRPKQASESAECSRPAKRVPTRGEERK